MKGFIVATIITVCPQPKFIDLHPDRPLDNYTKQALEYANEECKTDRGTEYCSMAVVRANTKKYRGLLTNICKEYFPSEAFCYKDLQSGNIYLHEEPQPILDSITHFRKVECPK